jgi:hypothetical protein
MKRNFHNKSDKAKRKYFHKFIKKEGASNEVTKVVYHNKCAHCGATLSLMPAKLS